MSDDRGEVGSSSAISGLTAHAPLGPAGNEQLGFGATTAARSRTLIEATFEGRCRHRTQDDLRKTRSLASAEAQFRDDYSGRFLIELLQNARDAYRKVEPDKRLGILKILRTKDAISVANVGAAITADVVIGSLTQIGASTKVVGEAIGHKGIGFKSVLEISSAPEIYSDRDPQGTFGLAVRFDQSAALEAIRRASERDAGPHAFDEWIAGLQEANRNPAHLPTLYFPIPNYEGDARTAGDQDIAALEHGLGPFDTVVRLPFSPGRLDETQQRVTEALQGLGTAMLLLIGCFERIYVDDQVEPSLSEEILLFENAPVTIADGLVRREVEILRTPRTGGEQRHERWLQYCRVLASGDGLEREVTVGVPLAQDGPGTLRPTAAPSTFHVFFPTEIQTALPFLYSAYFWVGGNRRFFAPSRLAENKLLIGSLAELTEEVVEDLLRSEHAFGRRLDVRRLPRLFAEAGIQAGRGLAAELHDDVYRRLGAMPWIACRRPSSWAKPMEVLICEEMAELPEVLVAALPESQIERIGLVHAASDTVNSTTTNFLRRLGAQEVDDDLLARALRASQNDRSDESFVALLELFARVEGRVNVSSVVQSLRGEAEAAFVPVVTANGSRAHVPPPLLEDRRGARRAMRLFEQPTRGNAPELGPPDCLEFAFLPALTGLHEDRRDLLKKLGISDYSTDNVVARLGEPLVETALTDAQHCLVARFVWELLSREGVSEFSVRKAVGLGGVATGFYRETVLESAPDDHRAKRRRALSRVRLPSRAGKIKEAGTLALSESWAVQGAEQVVFSALERVAPSDEAIVADVGSVAKWLGVNEREVDDSKELLRAFLRQLGVWDVIPIEAFSDHEQRSEESRVPWLGMPERDAQWKAVAPNIRLGDSFQNRHAVNVSEDARLLWPLVARGRDDIARVFQHGQEFYVRQAAAAFFCPRCPAHPKNRKMARDATGSLLAWQIRNAEWLPVTIDGGGRALARPADAWIVHEQVDGRQAARSAWSFLPVVEPAYRDVARHFGSKDILTATSADLLGVLKALREKFASGTLARNPNGDSAARQAFCALHRRLYDRLAEHSKSEGLINVGVLAEVGDDLSYVAPAEALHDDGLHAAYRRHFASLPFAVLPKEMSTDEAKRLGVRTFRVRTALAVGGAYREDQTADFRQEIDDVATLVLALQVHSPIRGPALELGSNAFRERAIRLHALRVERVDELGLALTVEGTSKVQHVPGRDFLEGTTTSTPLLVHDYRREDAKRLMDRLGRHVAALVEAPAAADTLTLMLQRETPEERRQFLVERGISSADIDRVRHEFSRTIHAGLDDDEKRWWWSVLDVFGVSDVETILDHEGIASALVGVDPVGVLRAALEARDLGYGVALRAALQSVGPALDARLRGRGDARGYVPPPVAAGPRTSAPVAPVDSTAPRKATAPGLPSNEEKTASSSSTEIGALWGLIAKARKQQMVTAPAAAIPPIASDASSGLRSRSPIRSGKVRRDDQALSRMGRQAELAALGFVLDPLVAIAEADQQEFRRIIQALVGALKRHMPGGPRVDDVVAHGRRLEGEALDPDTRVELLVKFLHLSETSDAFGCDLLGWLSVNGGAPGPLFLEVKSVANEPLRSFYVSCGEWETARHLREAFAFFILPRDTDQPEIIVDPVAWSESNPKKLHDTVDTYRFQYRVLAPLSP